MGARVKLDTKKPGRWWVRIITRSMIQDFVAAKVLVFLRLMDQSIAHRFNPVPPLPAAPVGGLDPRRR